MKYIKVSRVLSFIVVILLLLTYQNCGQGIQLRPILKNENLVPPEIETIDDETDEEPIVIPDEPPADFCQQFKESLPSSEKAMFQPEGYNEFIDTWEHAMAEPNYPKQFPDTPSVPYPVGSWTLRTRGNVTVPIRNNYISIPFVAETRKARHLEWIGASPYYGLDYLEGYIARPANFVFVTISPCPGDFRYTTSNARPIGDETFSSTCRKFAPGESQIDWADKTLITGPNGCALEAGKTYYINIIFENPIDGIQANRDTCIDGLSFGTEGVCEMRFDLR